MNSAHIRLPCLSPKYVMRPANKATLTNALWSPQLEDLTGPSNSVQYVLDGGVLLHRIPWSMGMTWDELCTIYTQYVANSNGKCVVVFDGYSDATNTNDCTYLRESSGCAGVEVHYTGDMTLQMKSDEFLSNKENKQRFIKILTDKLEQKGCEVHQARGDADILIVKTAAACADKQDTILIGDDTDLLIPLCYHAKNTQYNAFFQARTKNTVPQTFKMFGTLQQLKQYLVKLFVKISSSFTGLRHDLMSVWDWQSSGTDQNKKGVVLPGTGAHVHAKQFVKGESYQSQRRGCRLSVQRRGW